MTLNGSIDHVIYISIRLINALQHFSCIDYVEGLHSVAYTFILQAIAVVVHK